MKRLLMFVIAAALTGTGLWVALRSTPAKAAEDPAMQADKAFVKDLESGNKAAAEKYLDRDFSWIDTDGIMYQRDEAMEDNLKPLVPAASDVKYTEHNYGNVIWIQENEGNKWAAHFWVKRPEGWRLLHTNEIATRPASENPDRRPNYEIPCVNPCQVVPYKPRTANEKAVLASWREQESGVPENWYKHTPDSYFVVSSYGTVTKPQVWAMIQKGVAAHLPKVGVSPVLWMREWDFGTAVVMVACQPNYGGKAYWASRVFAPRNGIWMMMESYHNTIQAAPIMTEAQPQQLLQH